MKIRQFFFKNTSLRQTVAKNTFWILVSQMGGRLIRAFIVIYGARKIGAPEYGIFSYALSLATIFSLLADLGLDAAMIKESSAHPERSSRYFGTALVLKLTLILIAVILAFVLGSQVSTLEGADVLLPIVIIILVCDNLREFSFAVSRTHQKMENEAFVNIITNLGIVFFALWLIGMRASALYLSIGYAIGTAIGSFLGLYMIRPYVSGFLRNFGWETAKKLLRIGWPLAFAGILGTLMINTDTLLLGFWETQTEIGFYSAAQRPVSTLYGLLGILAAVTFPIVSNFAHTDRERLRAIVKKTIHISFVAAAPLVLGGVLVAEDLMIFIYGLSFSPAASSFQLLMLSLFANFATVTITNVLIAYNKQNRVLAFSLFGLISNAILDIIFIPIWGAAGSAFSTLLTQTVVALFLWVETTEAIGGSLMPPLKKTIVATLIMAFGVIGVSWVGYGVLSAVIVGGLIYGAMLVLQKEDVLREFRLLVRT